jgi:hypothetical protein
MPGISSLLRSAAATRKKIQSFQDAEVAFEWENSAQTYDDYATYSKYLNDRADNANDPSEKLSYASKNRSAQRSYVSNELQRSQMAIMEGRASTTDKMAAVQQLYYQAVDNGDFNLAQNLYSQYDALSIKAQNEAEVNTKSLAAAGSKAYKGLINDLTKGVDDVTLPTGQKVTPLAAISRYFEASGDTVGVMKSAQETLDALQGVIIDHYNNATSQDEIDSLEEKYGKGLQDLGTELTATIGGKKLNAQDVVNAIANDEYNNPTYGLKAVHNEATGQTEYKLQENNVDKIDYSRQFDEQGNEYYAPLTVRTDQNNLFFGTSDQGRGLNTEITDAGEIIGGKSRQDKGGDIGQTQGGTAEAYRDSSKSIANRLKGLGIDASQNGTTLTIKLPGENIERQATIQPDGSIRYFGDDGQMYEIGLTRRNLGTDNAPQIFEPGQQRAVAPDEISDFGSKSAFGGDLSKMSGQGSRYINSITGSSRFDNILPGRAPINIANDFGGYGGAATGGAFQGTSALLQGASFTRQQIQQEQAKQAMLQAQKTAALQASSNQFDLNQTPVQQLASNGVLRSQLKVSAPAPTPRIYVAPPAPTPQISGVGVAQPTGRVTVGSSSPAPRVVVR